jgi:hypothetical protein
MKRLTLKLVRCKQWILSVVIGRFRYKYEYTSPFGEEWWVYRLWFGFIPIGHKSMLYKGVEEQGEVQKYVDSLNDL